MKSNENRKSVLITQSQLKNYSGSEVVTLEVAEEFVKRGWEVAVLTHYHEEPIKDDFSKLGVRVIISNSQEAESLDLSTFSLLWVHHLVLSSDMLRQLNTENNKTEVIFHHMSFADPFETPLFPKAESNMANVILFNSSETKDIVIENIGNVIDANKIDVFDNPAPDRFLTGEPSKHARLKKIAVISNHPPEEILSAATTLRDKGIAVDFYGRLYGGVVARISPKLISGYDAVITIGKTVQYALLADVPAYCYDRFGGPGFINKSNYELAHYHNFSGRGFSRKTPEEITNELIGVNYSEVKENHHQLHEVHGREFLLSEKISNILGKASATERTLIKDTDLYVFGKFLDLQWRLLPAYAKEIHFSRNHIKKLEHDINASKVALSKVTGQLRTVEQSKSYKFGKLAMYIPRRIKSLKKK